MPDSTIIPSSLLEPDGVYQNMTVAVGITIKPLPDGKMRLAVADGNAEAVILLDDTELQHFVTLLHGACANAKNALPFVDASV